MTPRLRRPSAFLKLAASFSLLAVFLWGCASSRATLNQEAQVASDLPSNQAPPEYRIFPGDQLDVKLFYNPELNDTVLVRPDGKISLQLIHEVQAAGLTPAQLTAEITQLYAQELRKPAVTVIVRSFTGQRAYVGGEVTTPGLINFTPGMTVLQAVINAGGFKETAQPADVLVIRKGSDSRPVPVRVDLQQIIKGETQSQDVPLQPYDIVFVPKSWIAEADKFVNQYIEQLLLYRGANLGLGFSYELKGTTRH